MKLLRNMSIDNSEGIQRLLGRAGVDVISLATPLSNLPGELMVVWKVTCRLLPARALFFHMEHFGTEGAKFMESINREVSPQMNQRD